MPKFYYIARDSLGNKVSGAMEDSSMDDLSARLQAKGLTVIDIMGDSKESSDRMTTGKVAGVEIRNFHSGINDNDLVLLCRQLATLLGAGVTILKCLDILLKQVSSRKLSTVIKSLIKGMEAGLTFHEAMAKHPKVFSDLWVNLVESGEASGNLAVVLTRLASYLERNAAFKAKVISALVYPAILLFAGLGAILFLTLKIIPTFAELFKGFGLQLPLLTTIVLTISDVLRHNFLWIILGGVGAWLIFKKFVSTNDGQRSFEQFKFKLPVFGEFFRAIVVERFSSEMSTLVESGVPILYSLEIVEHSVGNLVMADAVRKIKEDVRDGKTLSQPLADSGFFEPMVVQMVNIGEEIGELPQMFKRINDFYQDYVETFLTRFTSMFEPIMLLFMGVIIGIMVIAVFLPIFQIAEIGK